MDVLTVLMSYILVIVPLLVFDYIIYEILDRQKRKRYMEAEKIAHKRKFQREVEMAQIGVHIMNERKKTDKPVPIRKVCGAFADMAEVWK